MNKIDLDVVVLIGIVAIAVFNLASLLHEARKEVHNKRREILLGFVVVFTMGTGIVQWIQMKSDRVIGDQRHDSIKRQLNRPMQPVVSGELHYTIAIDLTACFGESFARDFLRNGLAFSNEIEHLIGAERVKAIDDHFLESEFGDEWYQMTRHTPVVEFHCSSASAIESFSLHGAFDDDYSHIAHLGLQRDKVLVLECTFLLEPSTGREPIEIATMNDFIHAQPTLVLHNPHVWLGRKTCSRANWVSCELLINDQWSIDLSECISGQRTEDAFTLHCPKLEEWPFDYGMETY